MDREEKKRIFPAEHPVQGGEEEPSELELESLEGLAEDEEED